MHVRIRVLGKPEVIIAVESKLTKIERLRLLVSEKFDVEPDLLRMLYGGKLLEDGYTLFDYKIKLNNVIQVLVVPKENIHRPAEIEITPEPTLIEIDKETEPENEENLKEYKDAVSDLYKPGDLIDIRNREAGSWFEGKIVRIVYDPDASEETVPDENSIDSDNNPQTPAAGPSAHINKNLVSNKSPKDSHEAKEGDNLLYKAHIEDSDSFVYAKLNEIRPRARNIIEMKNLKVGQKVMVNYNIENPTDTGYWYDMKICEITKMRTKYKLSGTLYLEENGACTQYVDQISISDKIFQIENVIPLARRTDEDNEIMQTVPEKRTKPLNCDDCKDDDNKLCKNCGCFTCAGKDDPGLIVLCDECDKGFHISCLEPPMEAIPSGDWYCPSCKRDPNEIVAPGGSKQKKRTVKEGGRDWGRGMACIGKTKDCSLPRNHFGPIPGVEVGMRWCFRMQLSEIGVHRPPVSGIHGRDTEGAYSLVLSGGYEDDVDNGNEFTYTGSGGRNLSGNKRTAIQSSDQTLNRENRALARNCALPSIVYTGGDAGDNWRKGKPVRVSRSYKMMKHFPKYAPKEGIRYDGIYKVVKYYPEKGQSGFLVWKYLLRRDDPSPAPWEPDAKTFSIVYPDNFLEAEEEKKRLKMLNNKTKNTKKPALKDSNSNTDEAEQNIDENSNSSASNDSGSTTSNSDINTSTNNDENIPPKESKKNLTKKRARKANNSDESGLNTSSEGQILQDNSINASEEKEANPETCISTKASKEKKTKSPVTIKDFLKKSSNSSKNKANDMDSTLTNADDENSQKETIGNRPTKRRILKKRKNFTKLKLITTKSTADITRKSSEGSTLNNENKSLKEDNEVAIHSSSPDCEEDHLPPENTSPKNIARTISEEASSSSNSEIERLRAAKKRTLEKYKSSDSSASGGDKKPIKKKAKRDIPRKRVIERGESQSESEANKQTTPLAAGNSAEIPKDNVLTSEGLKFIRADTINGKKWDECIDIAITKGRMEFIAMVIETFRCAVCQDLVKIPITTPCQHNYCSVCLNHVLKTGRICPYCRHSLKNYSPEPNTNLISALKSILGESIVNNRDK